jgi:hypothetical protein
MLFGFELVFANAAERTDKIIGQTLPGGAGGDIKISVTDFGVIDIATNLAYVSHENPFS